MIAQKTTDVFPGTASVLAMAGACLMIVAGLLFLAVSAFIIPHLNSSIFNGSMNFNNTGHHIPIHDLPSFVGGILAGVGLFGLISGLVVLGSGIMVRIYPEQSTVFGVLILVFSVLSFLGTGGFIIGALLGIIGGIMTLRWRRPVTSASTSSGPAA